MSNASGTPTPFPEQRTTLPLPADLLIATHNRVQTAKATVDPTASYDVIGIAEAVARDGVPLSEVGEHHFLSLMADNLVQDRTGAPCPAWCTEGAGHRFEVDQGDGTQTRSHSGEIPGVPDRIYLAVVQQENRAYGDDSTVMRPEPPSVYLEVDENFTNSSELRQLAAGIVAAADFLDGLQ